MTLEEFKKFCLDNFVGHFDSDDDDMFNNDETGPTGSPVGPHRFACYGYWKGSDKKGYLCDNILLWCGKGKKDIDLPQPVTDDQLTKAMLKVGFKLKKETFVQMKLF